MQTSPRPYETYRHFKGGLYQIIALAKDSETGIMQVVYQQLYSPFEVYVRPLSMFLSMTDKTKYPEAKQEFRFEKIDISAEQSSEISKEQSVQADEDYDEEEINPLLLQFLDSDTYEEKLSILASLRNTISDDMVNTMAIALDVEVEDGELEERYNALKSCLITLEKYECNRLR